MSFYLHQSMSDDQREPIEEERHPNNVNSILREKMLNHDTGSFENESETVRNLSELFVEAPEEELLRFCRARGGSFEGASEMYKAYLKWRQGQGAPSNLLQAYQATDSKYARHTGFAKDGSPLILCQGARYDPDIGAETTALALAHFVDSILDAADARKVTVLVDVRPHVGWPNVPAVKMMSFFSLAASIFSDNYPERGQRIIIFPMPFVVRGLWAVVSRLFDPRTRDKFVILGGSAEKGSPCPVELSDYIALDQLPADARHMFAELESCS